MKPHRRNRQKNIIDILNIDHTPKIHTQKWTEYNKAQTKEKILLLEILNDLIDYFENNIPKRRGRPSLSTKDMIICCCIRTYSMLSSRRTISDIKLAKESGYIQQIPHFNSILNFLNKKELTATLIELIQITSLPLEKFEEDFTSDSSGFSTSQFEKWSNIRHDRGKQRHYRKAHVMSGVKTNIITAIKITNGHTNDCKPFSDLVRSTYKNFDMKEVSADLAYSTRDNLAIVNKCGAIPYIPFKKNATGKSKGAMIWRKMFNYFCEHYDMFMEHYHKRSNAETVFSMIKKKFGGTIKSKNTIGQTNEILCKALCHNICVLIQESFENGLELDFK